MSDWIGRKYKGKTSFRTFIILTEPFEHQGVKYVNYGNEGETRVRVSMLSEFTSDLFMTRILEPKFEIDQDVVHYSRVGRIIAVSPEVDNDNDFAYLLKYTNGDVDIAWENDLKVSM